MDGDELFWRNLLDDLKNKRVLLFISNAMVLNSVFSLPECKHSSSNIEEQIALRWAEKSGYPLSDKYNLANVAQFILFNEESSIETKRKYLNTCRELLAEHLQECLPEKFELARETGWLDDNDKFPADKTISQVLQYLDLPNWETEPMVSKLAEIKSIKYYFTTSYFNLLEHALEKKRTDWYSQAFNDPTLYFKGEYDEARQNINPLVIEQPFVYYFFGNDADETKMTLTEDDHVNFLTEVSQVVLDRTIKSSICLPEYIKVPLKEKTLLFLGYRWQDWEFRTLFRFVTSPAFMSPGTRQTKSQNNIIIQLDHDFNDRIDQAKKYFGESYFSTRHYVIREKGTSEFVDELFQKWNALGIK